MNAASTAHTAVALRIAAGAHVKEVAARAGHTAASFTLDRWGHRFESADEVLAEWLDAHYQNAPAAAPAIAIARPSAD